jgi:hypothetical protein
VGAVERKYKSSLVDRIQKVKHHRNTYFSQASLKNALNAIAGLFILLLFFYRDEAQNARLNPAPVLFHAGAPFIVDYSFYPPPATFYKLDDDGLA